MIYYPRNLLGKIRERRSFVNHDDMLLDKYNLLFFRKFIFLLQKEEVYLVLFSQRQNLTKLMALYHY